MEIWKDIKNYEGLYQVSNYGRVKSLDHKIEAKIKYNEFRVTKGKILKLNQKRNGYLSVDLSKNGIVKTAQVHRLVANAFIPNPENKPQVNHINAKKYDNRICNLEWTTAKENMKHASKSNLLYNPKRKKVRCKQLNKIFESSYNAGEWLNNKEFKNRKNTATIANKIRMCCNGKQKIAYGYTWEFV